MIWGSQICPWPEPGTEEAAAVAFPGEGAHRRRGKVGERIEEIESYLDVVFSRSGAAGRGVGGGAARPVAVASCGDGAPAVRGEGEQVWELHGAMRKVSVGSIGTEEYRR